MKLIRSVIVLAIFLICAASSRAQPAAVQQLQINQLTALQQAPLPGLRVGTNAPELYPGENADIGPQHILRLNPRPNYFDVYLDSQVYYSDDANFATKYQRLSSFIYLNTIQIAFAPELMDWGPGKIAPIAGLASQWYNYDSHAMSPFDFDAQTAFVGGRYAIGQWLITANLNDTRLMSQSHYDQTYQEFLPSLSLQRFFAINDKMLLALGDQVDYHVTKIPEVSVPGGTNSMGKPVNFNQPTDLSDHFDNIIFVTLNWQVTKQLDIQPFYRFQYSYYRRDAANISSREDYLQAVGISAIYTFNQYISARIFYNFNSLRTDDPGTSEYHEMNGGLGGTLDIKF